MLPTIHSQAARLPSVREQGIRGIMIVLERRHTLSEIESYVEGLHWGRDADGWIGLNPFASNSPEGKAWVRGFNVGRDERNGGGE